MGDLDAQGNVDNSSLPAYKPRHNANATDIRRSVGVAPSVFKIGAIQVGTFQTIADLTGVKTCTEGVEIIVHGCTFGSGNVALRTCGVAVKLGGVTGVAVSEGTDDFRIIRMNSGALSDPLLEASEGIFIPTNDPTKVSIGGLTTIGTLSLHTNALFQSTTEVRIK